MPYQSLQSGLSFYRQNDILNNILHNVQFFSNRWLLQIFTSKHSRKNLPIYNPEATTEILLTGFRSCPFLSLTRKKKCSEKQ